MRCRSCQFRDKLTCHVNVRELLCVEPWWMLLVTGHWGQNSGKAKHLATEPPRISGTLASQGQLSQSVQPNTSSVQCVCVLHVCKCGFPIPHFLSSLSSTRNQYRPVESCLSNNNSFQIQNRKNHFRYLLLKPITAVLSAMTRKLITPLSRCSNADVCSQHLRVVCAVFPGPAGPSTFPYLSTSAWLPADIPFYLGLC